MTLLASPLVIDLVYPAPMLWPNGGSGWNYHKKNKVTGNHKRDAFFVARAAMNKLGAKRRLVELPEYEEGSRLLIAFTVHPKGLTSGSIPDKDNCVASVKAYLDGISAALGVNDVLFDLERPVFGERRKYGGMVFTI